MLIVPLSEIRRLNWKIEVVPIEDIWVMDKNASGYRLLGLPDPIDGSEPVTLRYLQGFGFTGGGGFTGFTGFIRDDNDTVKAHHIDWGCTGDKVNSSQVPYCNSEDYPTVEAALDYLLYVPLSISSFYLSTGTVEIGSTVTSVTLNWGYNKAVTSQSIDQGIGSLSAALRTHTHTGSWTTDKTYTLTASDGTNTPTRQASFVFRHYRYWGGNSATSLTDSDVIALGTLSGAEGGKEFDTTRVKSTFTITCSAEYIYYCYPSAWGLATFTVNGLLNTAWTLNTRTFVNASGNSTSFNIYRSDNLLTGTYQIAVT